MSHEMYEHDHAVYVQEPAWHGLGTVVENAPTLSEALELAQMDFNIVLSNPLTAYHRGEFTKDSKFYATVRTDTNEILGVVGKNYPIIQNSELFEIANALGDTASVETAGTLKNGAQSYLLMKCGEWDINGNDSMLEYFCLMNSHDGTLSLSGLPTSIRVVCHNTLSWAISEGSNRTIKISHRGDVEDKIIGLQEAMSEWTEHRSDFRAAVQTLARKDWTKEEVQNFWLDMYMMLEEPFVPNPKTEEEEKSHKKAMVTLSKWSDTFDAEASEFGSSAWIAANSVTNWLQHKEAVRGRKRSAESTISNKLIGPAAKNSSRVMRKALALV